MAKGKGKHRRHRVWVDCNVCKASGMVPAKKIDDGWVKCPKCNGHGQVQV